MQESPPSKLSDILKTEQSDEYHPHSTLDFNLSGSCKLEKDLFALPLLLEKKHRLFCAKALQFVFLRLKENLSYHLRKRVSTFKLVRALQNVFLNAKLEPFYSMKSGPRSFREPLEMPFTKSVGPTPEDASWIKESKLHTSYEIFQMYANASLSMDDINEIKDIRDTKDISNFQIEEILNTQQMLDVLTYIYRASMRKFKLEAFNRLKSHSFGLMTSNYFSTGQLNSTVVLGLAGELPRQRKNIYLLRPTSTTEAVDKLSSCIYNIKKKYFEEFITQLKQDDKELSIDFSRESRGSQKLNQSSFRQKLSNYFISKRRMKSLDIGGSKHAASARDSSEIPRVIGDESKMSDSNFKSFAFLPRPYNASARDSQYIADDSNSIPKLKISRILEDSALMSPNHLNNSELNDTVNVSNPTFHSNPRAEQGSYISSRSVGSEVNSSVQSSKAHAKFGKLLKMLGAPRSSFRAKNMDKYLRYEHSLIQVARIFNGSVKRLLLRGFESLKGHKWESILKHRVLSNLINKQNERREEYKREYFLKWKQCAGVSLSSQLGINAMVSVLKNRILRNLEHSLLALKANKPQKQPVKLKDNLNIKNFLLHLKSPEYRPEDLLFSRLDQTYSSGSTMREIMMTGADGMGWRIQHILETKTFQNKKEAFEKILAWTGCKQKLDLQTPKSRSYAYPSTTSDIKQQSTNTKLKRLWNKKLQALQENAIRLLVKKISNVKTQILRESFAYLFRPRVLGKEKELRTRIFFDMIESFVNMSKLEAYSDTFTALKRNANMVEFSTKRFSLGSLGGFSNFTSPLKTLRERFGLEKSAKKLDESGQYTFRGLDTDYKKEYALRTIHYIVEGHIKTTKILEYNAFSRIKVFSENRKLYELTNQYQQKVGQMEAQREIELATIKKASALGEKLHVIETRVHIRAKHFGFNRLLKYYETCKEDLKKLKYKLQNNKELKDLKLKALFRALSIRITLDAQMWKAIAFSQLSTVVQDDKLFELSCFGIEKSSGQPTFQQSILGHTLETLFKIQKLKDLTHAFAMLKDHHKRINSRRTDLMKVKLANMLEKIIRPQIPKILTLKAWKKLKAEAMSDYSPGKQLRQERSKLRKKSALYLVKIVGLIENFSSKRLLAESFNILKNTFKDRLIESLNGQIYESNKSQDVLRIFLNGMACMGKLLYHAEKRDLENGFLSIKNYVEETEVRRLRKSIQAEKLETCLEKISCRILLTSSMERLKALVNYEKEVQSEKRILGNITNIDRSHKVTNEFRKSLNRNIKNESFENKSFSSPYQPYIAAPRKDSSFLNTSLNQDITHSVIRTTEKSGHYESTLHTMGPNTTSSLQEKAAMVRALTTDQPLIIRPKRKTRVPSTFLRIDTSEIEPQIESSTSSAETPSPIQPLTETPNEQFWLQPSARNNDYKKSDRTSFGTDMPEGNSTTERSRSNLTLPKSPGRRKISWQSAHTRFSSRGGNNENGLISTQVLESQDRGNNSSGRTILKAGDLEGQTPFRANENCISARLQKLANFSFKPENKTAYLQLDRESNYTDRSQKQLDFVDSARCSSGTVTTLPIPMNIQDSESNLDSRKGTPSLLEKLSSSNFPSYRSDTRDKTTLRKSLEPYTRAPNQLVNNRLTLRNQEKKKVPTLIGVRESVLGHSKLLESPRQGHLSIDLTNRLNRTNIIQDNSVMESLRSRLEDSESFIDVQNQDRFYGEPVVNHKKNKSMVETSSMQNRNTRNEYVETLNKRNKEIMQNLLQSKLPLNLTKKKPEVSSRKRPQQGSCVNKNCEHCDLCGKKLAANSSYTVYQDPSVTERMDTSKDDKSLKAKFLERIVQKKMDYLEKEKKKEMTKLRANQSMII